MIYRRQCGRFDDNRQLGVVGNRSDDWRPHDYYRRDAWEWACAMRPTAVSIASDGSLLVTFDNQTAGHGVLYRVDPVTGNRTIVSSADGNSGPTSTYVLRSSVGKRHTALRRTDRQCRPDDGYAHSGLGNRARDGPSFQLGGIRRVRLEPDCRRSTGKLDPEDRHDHRQSNGHFVIFRGNRTVALGACLCPVRCPAPFWLIRGR